VRLRVPNSQALINDGFVIYGVDASPSLIAEFRRRFPDVNVACEAVEDSRLFDRTFDGVMAVGLLFLLSEDSQRDLIRRVGLALNSGGQFLFTSPAQCCTWTDILTGRDRRRRPTVQQAIAAVAVGIRLARFGRLLVLVQNKLPLGGS